MHIKQLEVLLSLSDMLSLQHYITYNTHIILGFSPSDRWREKRSKENSLDHRVTF